MQPTAPRVPADLKVTVDLCAATILPAHHCLEARSYSLFLSTAREASISPNITCQGLCCLGRY